MVPGNSHRVKQRTQGQMHAHSHVHAANLQGMCLAGMWSTRYVYETNTQSVWTTIHKVCMWNKHTVCLNYNQPVHTWSVVTTTNLCIYETNTWSAVTTNNLCIWNTHRVCCNYSQPMHMKQTHGLTTISLCTWNTWSVVTTVKPMHQTKTGLL